jgi:hypothetical protein
MVTEEWSMEEEALVKEGRVTGRESTTFVWVSKNSMAPELSQIQSLFLYINLVKCNLNKPIKPAWVPTHSKCITQIVNSVAMLDGRIQDAGHNRIETAIAPALPRPGP